MSVVYIAEDANIGRTVNGLSKIWKYNLKDKTLTQITSGVRPDYSAMPDPGGKRIYFVNGKFARKRFARTFLLRALRSCRLEGASLRSDCSISQRRFSQSLGG
jgi:hypothetical protein